MGAPRPSRHNPYFDLLDACKQRGCPICTLVLGVVRHYLEAIVYECVNDPPTRIAVVASHGYCNDHTWQLHEMRASLGAAIMYRDVLRGVMNSIAVRSAGSRLSLFAPRKYYLGVLSRLTSFVNSAEPPGIGRSLADPHAACPACQVRERSELGYLGALLEHIDEMEFLEAFRGTGGLCIVHLDQAASTARDIAAVDRLLAVQVELLQSLDAELSEFLRKQDYRFRAEDIGHEGDSWIRALAMVAGKRGVR
ncbi:MAG: hypothetical protein JWO59_2279 [Chloroflexi bacterium]|nr:hypothetical protein [Chloroflexota bacterium]